MLRARANTDLQTYGRSKWIIETASLLKREFELSNGKVLQKKRKPDKLALRLKGFSSSQNHKSNTTVFSLSINLNWFSSV